MVTDLASALEVSNSYGPEHLILEVERPRQWLERVTNAGSVFLGEWTPEPMGDYCSGTNHVLPTEGYARALSGLSLIDFTKRITVQEITVDGLRGLGPVARTLAQLEGLDAHANAVEIRLATLGTRSTQ
jgi:histidinol dehydrogenase